MNTTKRIYESMYIIDSTLTDEQVDSVIAKYTSLIAAQGGEVKAVGRWDKRRLAYDIMGHGEGLYILMFFEAEPAVAKELDRVYRISDDVFRFLITRVDLEHVDTSRIDHPVQAAEAPPVEAVEEAVEEEAAPAAEVTEAPAETPEPTEEIAEPVAEEPAKEEAAETAEEAPAAEEQPAEPEEAKTEEAAAPEA